MSSKSPLRILVVDDSATARAALALAFSQGHGATVVGEASTGEEALRLVKRLRPDLVTMDVYLQGTTGIDVTRAIMAECPTPILVVTACHPTDPTLAFRAVEAGALDICAKLPSPQSPSYAKEATRLVRLARALADVPLVRRHAARPRARPAPEAMGERGRPAECALLAIGASTGGPPLVGAIVKALPATFSVPVVVIQHITPGFGAGYADWLATETGKSVVYVAERQRARATTVYVAGDHRHLVIDGHRELHVADTPPVHHQRPAIDVFFESAARTLGATVVGVLLSGMGSDGAQGLARLHAAGALTIAQSPASCAVASMPESAVALGAATLVLDPEAIIRELLALAGIAGSGVPHPPHEPRKAHEKGNAA